MNEDPGGKSLYRHKPLNLKRQQIRLIQLVPTAGGSIACTIKNFDQGACPPYEAISYVWGPQRPTRLILMNGAPFEIRDNLWQFLHRATNGQIHKAQSSARYAPKYLWIDQLCIDQSSVKERNHQVRAMARIFTDADLVVSWLGTATESSDLGMDYIADFAKWKIKHKDTPLLERMREASWLHWKDHPDYAEIETAVATILQRPYWTRLWIAQEFVLARELVLECGEKAVPWLSFYWFMDWISEPGKLNHGFRHLAFRAWSTRHKDPFHFERVLCLLNHLECENPRDKIFGLLGLVPESESIVVDYAKTPYQVFFEAMLKVKDLTEGQWKSLRDLGKGMGLSAEEASVAITSSRREQGTDYAWIDLADSQEFMPGSQERRGASGRLPTSWAALVEKLSWGSQAA